MDNANRSSWRCRLIEFGGEPDHVRLLIDIHPALALSVLINNLKTASARRARNRCVEHLAAFYSKPLFWRRAYFVGSVGGGTLETVRDYVPLGSRGAHAPSALDPLLAAPSRGNARAIRSSAALRGQGACTRPTTPCSFWSRGHARGSFIPTAYRWRCAAIARGNWGIMAAMPRR